MPTSLASLGGLACCIVFCAFFVLASLQAAHAFSLFRLRQARSDALEFFYEGLLGVHLMLMCGYVFSFAVHMDDPALRFAGAVVPYSALLWFNALVACFGVAHCIVNRRWMLFVELVIVVLCIPPMTPLSFLIVIEDLGYFTFRIAYRLLTARIYQRSILRRNSAAESLDRLPEGVLYIRADGRVLYMNDTMRACLVALRLPTDLADARTIWPTLLGRYGAGVDDAGGADGEGDESGLRVRIGEDEIRHFTCEDVELGGKHLNCIIAYDVTREDTLRAQIEETNAQLEHASDELRKSLDDVAAIADNEAMLHMRSQVHDVIGQRLSILHRYLEDERITDDTVAKITPLLATMVSEVAQDPQNTTTTEARTTLENVIEAFAVIGVELRTYGQPPADAPTALAFTRIIREASTNAIRHGQATRVFATFSGDAGVQRLTITNNGSVPGNIDREGSGTRGMRAAVEDLGGTFAYKFGDEFSIEATVPQ